MKSWLIAVTVVALGAFSSSLLAYTQLPNSPLPPIGGSNLYALQGILTVTKTADTNDGVCNAGCSLREAIVAASPGDTINIPAGTYT